MLIHRRNTYSLIACLILLTAVLHITCKKNTAPVIESITADPDSVGPGGLSVLVVNAVDEGDDSLSYLWTCANGLFSSTANDSTEWTAPNTSGLYTINITVTDEHDAAADSNIAVRVGAGQDLIPPDVTYEAANEGSTLHLSWTEVTGADGYIIRADGNIVDTITNLTYAAIVPAKIYTVSAYAGTHESEETIVDCTPVSTAAVNVWGMSDPSPDHPSGMGFVTSGVVVALALSDTINWPLIDYFFDDLHFVELTMVSPSSYVPPFNSEVNCAVNTWQTNFDSLPIADPPGSYIDQITLVQNCVFSLWMDPGNDGWGNINDHFAKIYVESIIGSAPPFEAVLVCAYQLIPGLRWLVTP